MKKWFISFIIAILPLAASAEIVQVDGLWYNLDDTAPVATVVSWQNESYSGDIVIPATINYGGTDYTVTGIGENAFNGCENVTSIIISEGVQTIETSAFMSCRGLKSVELPASLTTIGFWSFAFCDNLSYVIYKAENPVEIDRTAFCSGNSVLNGVESYNYSSAILYVPNGVLANYQNTTGWDSFPTIFQGERNEAKVGDLKYAYASGSLEAAVIRDDYSSLESVNIPSTVTIDGAVYAVKAIGNAAFRENQQITSVTFNEGLVLICKDAFSICSQAVFNSLPTTIKFIGNNSFCSCNRIEEIIIPEGCAVIESMAFAWCGNIEWIELPSTLTSLGQTAFAGSSNLKTVISRISRPFAIHDDVFCKEEQWNEVGEATIVNTDATLYVPTDTKTSYQETDGWKLFSEVVEGELKIKTVGDFVYSYLDGGGVASLISCNNPDLRDVIIPGSITIDGFNYTVKSIASEALRGHIIESLVIESGVETIGAMAFSDTWLKELTLPASLKTIGEASFRSISAKYIIIPENVDSIGHGAFMVNQELSYVVSRRKNPIKIGDTIFGNCNGWGIEGGVLTYDQYTTPEAVLYVPNGTKSSYQSVGGWNVFTEIIEGEPRETTVGGLNYFYLDGGGTATVIAGDYSSLDSVTIPGTITVDGNSYTVVAIADDVFANCNNLTSVTLNDGLKTIGERAFQDCWKAEFNGIPSTILSIGRSAFINCSGFTRVDIPNGCTSIGREAFAGNYNLNRVEFPNSLTTIDEFAFANCGSLETVISRINSPFSIEKSVFCSGWYEDDKGKLIYEPSRATLYVPVNTKSSYQDFDGWKMFADIVEGELKEGSFDGLNYTYLVGKNTASVVSGDYSSLTSVTIPSTVIFDGVSYSVTSIANSAFRNCSNLSSVIFEDGLESIGNNAFQECYSTVFGELPSSLRSIGDFAFNNCNEITDLVIPEGCRSIGNQSFQWCNQLSRLELPSTLSSIGEYAFLGCDKLSSVVSRIQEPFAIDDNVFCRTAWDESEQKTVYNPSRANLYVPEGTTSKYQAIKGWTMFAAIYEGEVHEAVVGDLKYSYLPSSQVAIVIADDYSKLVDVTIPSNVTIEGEVYQVKEIGSGAFREYNNISSVTFEDGLEVIGDYAFQGCWNTEFNELPYTVTTIGESAFNNCNKISTLILPENLRTIGDYAFNYCDGLMQVVLPSSLANIGERAFANCRNLIIVTSRIYEPINIADNVFVTSSGNGDNYKETASAATLCVPEGTKAKYQAIKGWTMFKEILEGEMLQASVDGLTYIYNRSSAEAYVTKGDNYSNFTSVTIPANVTIDGDRYRVTAVGARAFSSTSITSVKLEEGIKVIEQEAFSWCQSLTKVSLPSSLEEIKVGAFNECAILPSIEIPANVSLIRETAFSYCRAMTSIKVSADNKTYDSRSNCNAIIETASNTLIAGCKNTIIPETVTAIGQDAFDGCQFTEMVIPSSVKTIGDQAFLCCDQFTEIVLPEGVESIGTSAFHSCDKMETIEIPNSVKQIDAWAIGNCRNLVNLVTYIENPYEIPDVVFGDDQEIFTRAKLYVPKGKKSTYQRTECWDLFENVEEMIGGTMSVPDVKYNGRYLTLSSAEDGRIYYSLDGSKPNVQYKDTITCYDFITVKAIAKRFGSVTSDTLNFNVDYVYDGVTARTANGGILAKAFEWSGTDKIETLDVAGTLNDDDFGTIRGLSKLNTLNMSASKMESGIIPTGAFANTKLQWYVSPYTMTGVGANIFKGCDQLAAITWNSSSTELPEDVVTDVANPNLLVYAKSLAMIPYSIKNVVINGTANNIVLADSTGNNNFYVPEEFTARRISYTHDYKQKTVVGKTQGWETIALPFTVSSITHETNGELSPLAIESAEKPFWLYELGDNGLEAATKIEANIPYLICMPNDDAYGDEYMQGGLVTFSAKNVTITTSTGTAVSQGDRQFVPTYKRVAASSDIYVLNVNEAVGDNPMGSAFIQNLREVRPFEAYSVHGTNRSRIISVSSLGGGNATGINDLMLKKDEKSADAVVKVYSLSGALIKQGKREEVLRSLPKGLYIINGKKIIK